MLAIKECLIREGVLNLTSTPTNHGQTDALGAEENRPGVVGSAAVAGVVATTNPNNIYDNKCSDTAAVSNNLRAIITNYNNTYGNDNRYNRYNDKMTTAATTTATMPLALDSQLTKLRDQKSVDTIHSPNTNYENKSSNCSLSSASVTAKSSCQQTSSVYDKIKQHQQLQQQQQQLHQSSKHHSNEKQQHQQPGSKSSSSSSTRYHGVHPHFHHHTAPAYYTDVNLHIHTPKANDATSLNENYQSVYNTPTQLVKEHYFPKTSTATVVPPPIGTGAAVIGRASTTSPTLVDKRERERSNKAPINPIDSSASSKSGNTAAARAAFFRGGSAGSSGYNNNSNSAKKSHEPLAKSSPAFGRPTETGELNDTTYEYTPYEHNGGGSFVVVDINSSSDCSKYSNNHHNIVKQFDNIATDITQQQQPHDSINHNYNNNNIISIPSPTSPAGTNTTSTTTTSAGRSRNSHRFAGKRRAVRVRSESRPISALYDIICKEKGLDIGTSTTNEEDSSAASNEDDAHHSARSNNNSNNKNNNKSKSKSKERSHPRSSSSRNNSRKNSKDYTEISNYLTTFVANSLSNYLGGKAYDQSNMDHAATASGDTNATHDRAKRSHKTRASSGHKPGTKKRKDVSGKTKASTPRSPRDEALNGDTSEDSNEVRAQTTLSARSKHRADCSRRMNGVEKAASLPPQLHATAAHTTTTSAGVPQKVRTHTNNGESNTHLNVGKRCSIHCRCNLGCECRAANSAHRPSHYPYEYHQSSLPPNLSSGTCSSVRSPSTADDDSFGYSPEKLFIEPVNMNLSGIPSSPANAKNANSSSSGVVLEQASSINSVRNGGKERVGRAHQRRLREEMRRHTDLPQLDSLSPSSLSNISQLLGSNEKTLSEDEGVASVKQQEFRATKARRFINRPSRTPSRGRSASSAHNSPHSARRNTQHAVDTSTSSASPPPADSSHGQSLTAGAARDVYNSSNLSLPPVSPNDSTVTIEDVGSASSNDHIAHIRLSPLEIMTNSATPATELRPPANGNSGTLDVGEAHPADTEVNAEAGTANFGVQVAISAAEALRQRKYDVHTHKTPHRNPSKSNTQPITTRTSAMPTITSGSVTNRLTTTNVNQREQQQLRYNNKNSNYGGNNANHNNNTSTCTPNNSNSCHHNSSYAMPTETFLLKQKAAMLAASSANTNSNISAPVVVVKKKPLSPLQIIAMPHNATVATPSPSASVRETTPTTTAHQLSHQLNAKQHPSDVGVHRQQQQQLPPQIARRPSPLLGAPLLPFSLARTPLSPCTSPHYVRPTKASRLRAAALDKKKCEDETIQRPRSPCCGSPLTSPRPVASPKHQSPRLSTSSSSDNPRPTTADSESDSKLAQTSSITIKPRLTSTSSNDSPTTTNKKLVPSVSVSVKQNLCEMQFNGGPKKSGSSKLKKPRVTATPSPSTECTAKFTRSAGRLSTAEESDSHVLAKAGKPLPRLRISTIKSSKSKSTNDLKPASSDSSPAKTDLSPINGATPVSPLEDRDKSSKRKSNLNRSLNEEATVDSDDSLAARRRRRRELGMVRQLVPPDDAVLREMLSPHQNKMESSAKNVPSNKSPHNELAYHMEIARRGWDLVNPSVSNRARSETGSPKFDLNTRENIIRERPSANRLARRSDTLHLGELRKLRSNDVNRKVNERTKTDLAEIKKIAEQANVEMAMMASGIAAELAAQAVRGGEDYIDNDVDEGDRDECVVELATPARYGIHSRQQATIPPPAPSYTELEVAAEAKERDSSPTKHATFVDEERIYYEPEGDEQFSKSVSNTTMSGGILRQRILKARSMERDAGHEPPKLSPILRRRSTDDPTYIPVPTSASVHSTSPSTSTQNHIVSILKKKDHIAGESSSASSNASPVTFSANVVDTPASKQKRAGILKKRSSLDESRYYSRSHSPDERSILIKSARRNSLEETAGLQQQQQQQHGILKQSSYESSKSDGCPSATEPHPHGILKKKDSTSTPSDGGTHAPKHVSISQAVKMAAAELGHETADSQAFAGEHDESGYTPSNEEYEIRPILKLESVSSDDAMRPPKPILKKKSSGDSDEYEIRPILKTSRKSSREEFDLGGSISEDGRHYSEPPPPIVRPILKTDSPSKRRSLGGEELEQDVFSAENVSGQSPSLLKRRTRSLERQEAPVVDLGAALNAIATSQAAPLEFVSTPITTGGSISVAERIKNMEMFLSSNGTSPSTPADGNTSWESPLQSGVTPKLFKPSAIRRDMYRDRYKTQPITNDEKLHFKATASPLDTSTASAFKPTKSLDTGLNYNTFAHLNAPSAASSVSPGSSYTLTRCSTQPLHSQHYFKAAETSSSSDTPPPPQPPQPPLRATIGRHNSLSDSFGNNNTNNHNNSISEQLTLSGGSDSDRIFEMSGIEENLVPTEGKSEDADTGGAGVGLTRKNSVRARANMFQQLQEKTRSAEGTSATAGTALGREERTSPRRASSQLSPTSSSLPTTASVMSSSISSTSGIQTNNHEEPKTPQNPIRTDEEIEPTSLPVSERLRFFTNLTEAASRSASSSYTRSPSQRFLTAIDRCGSANSFSHNNSFTFTPRSSYNGGSTSNSSASVTPTPMECCSPPLCDQQQLISINEIDSPLQLDSERHTPSPSSAMPIPHAAPESLTYTALAKSSSQTLLPSVLAQRLAMSAPTPNSAVATSPSSLTPVTRRIKMKTIGKLLLPHTFLNNERNSFQSFSSNASENSVCVGYAHSDTCESENGSYIEADDSKVPPPVPLKKIGKIKSPFIENCLQMQQKTHQLNSKCMKYDHKSTPHNALGALENNVSNGTVGSGGGGGGERDANSLPPRKPLQNGNAGLPPPPRIETNEDSKVDTGKENNYCDINGAPLLALSPTASSIAVSEQLSHSPVVEMRKKFTRIMSNATLSTVAQRHVVHSLTNGTGISSGNGNAPANGGNVHSAPTTPRNSIIDDKFAKYFGLAPGSNQQPCATTATNNKAVNGNQRTPRAQDQNNTAAAHTVGASETSLSSRSSSKYPPLPPPDFAHTPNGELHVSAKEATNELSLAMNNSSAAAGATPHEAINHNVRSNSNTPYYTPPSVCAYDVILTQTSSATALTSNGCVSAVQRRRDMSKRQRANTTNVTFTPTSSNTKMSGAQADTPNTGRTRALRSRALTLTHGVPLPEVKRFEDIVVTKEEFQLASKEFERIFLGVI